MKFCRKSHFRKSSRVNRQSTTTAKTTTRREMLYEKLLLQIANQRNMETKGLQHEGITKGVGRGWNDSADEGKKMSMGFILHIALYASHRCCCLLSQVILFSLQLLLFPNYFLVIFPACEMYTDKPPMYTLHTHTHIVDWTFQIEHTQAHTQHECNKNKRNRMLNSRLLPSFFSSTHTYFV